MGLSLTRLCLKKFDPNKQSLKQKRRRKKKKTSAKLDRKKLLQSLIIKNTSAKLERKKQSYCTLRHRWIFT